MPKVLLLEDELINKIAAGEVVERPVSIVKELVENAMDAGARFIEIDLEDGGKQSISVRDDGLGMSEEDAVMAVKRHCTSKIANWDDLFQIETMGFRGEALAAISAVSEFVLTTQRKGDPHGTRITMNQGTVSVDSCHGPIGTTVTASRLFSTIPARKAFLKTASAEFAQCLEFVQANALSKPHIGFRLRHNQKLQFEIEASSSEPSSEWGEEVMRQRASLILKEKTPDFLYLTEKNTYGQIEGLISPPGFEKGSGKHMFCFVNGRLVKDKALRFAILRGYHSHLLKGKFPVCIINLLVDPSLVDVNVHPAKAEVRFQYQQETQSLIATSLKERLRKGEWAVSASSFESSSFPSSAVEETTKSDAPLPQLPKVHQRNDLSVFTESKEQEPSSERYYRPSSMKSRISSFDTEGSTDVKPNTLAAPSHSEEPPTVPQNTFRQGAKSLFERPVEFDFQPDSDEEAPTRSETLSQLIWSEMDYIGCFAKCYLMFSYRDNFIAVDQHAFHERVLYERLLKNRSLLQEKQRLLMPEVISCSASELAAILENRELLFGLGFEIESVSDCEVQIVAVPSLMQNADLESLVSTLALTLDGQEMTETLNHNLISTMACHSAVRAGEQLTSEDLEILLHEAETVDFYQNCPHGRRVLRIFSKREVERWFDR
ncbi:MAG: DNA mismatch repair endonuclease MutL [Pseudobacteriovorax sp.]|nr:DNA mismatch repair endonuclease MutL [Pseudobacteriovorax sp.]